MKKILNFLLLFTICKISSAQIDLVKDINKGSAPTGSEPENFVALNGWMYFTATDINGTELWKTNGTATGTVMVKDIDPGIQSSDPDHLTVFNNALYFSADDGIHGTELWKSDGSASGTVMLKDINPGSQNGFIFGY